MSSQKYIEYIGELLGKNDLKTAIQELKQLLSNHDQLNEVIMQSARYTDLTEKIRMGTISFDDANTTKNKIRYAILDLLRDIEENIEENSHLKKGIDDYLLKQAEQGKKYNTAKIGRNSNNNILIQDSRGDFNIK